MNKKMFLKELEKRLNILEVNERKDIVNEYSNIIDEKIKRGQTEEEAVGDFGPVEQLCEEILSAYKINTEYGKTKTNTIIEETESFVKKMAVSLSLFTKRVVSDIKESNFTIEMIFEILIKSLILLLVCAILRLPFIFIETLGIEILNVMMYPVDVLLGSIWKIIISIIYLFTCVIIFVIMFKEYTNRDKVIYKKETIEEKKIKKERKKNETEIDKSPHIIFSIIKFLVILFGLFPLFAIMFGLIIFISFVLFLLLKKITVYGVLILLIGLFYLFYSIYQVIYKIFFTKKNIKFYPFIISAVLIVMGGMLSFENFLHFDYYSSSPLVSFGKSIDEVEYNIKGDIKIKLNNYSLIIDNNLDNNVINIETTYNKDLINIKPILKNNKIYMEYKSINHLGYEKGLYQLVIDNLQDHKIYNYQKLFDYEVNIYANEDTIRKIEN